MGETTTVRLGSCYSTHSVVNSLNTYDRDPLYAEKLNMLQFASVLSDLFNPLGTNSDNITCMFFYYFIIYFYFYFYFLFLFLFYFIFIF